MLLALQKLFMSRKAVEHPVPHFLIFDQPSQVYFPVKRAAKDDGEHELNDEDRIAVRKVFLALAAAVSALEGRLQIIVLDHADEGVWGTFQVLYSPRRGETKSSCLRGLEILKSRADGP
ncbi:DUF3732 domain-containing protein [Pseudomonas mosselii]|uniref:DUF3732 domain-containing protein n=1 Tax=unclassified Pseudomonas TaxID=196821 RepID=UPI0020C4A75E|nr:MULTISPECIES: DUF3732 domain-containing protein [unclassified Pseudomonas]MCP8633415.1 DUF3732 domain-containing protein [Pseudomonas sp. DVZ6]MDD7782920.1 DUF3732 domain-containing protein [Pseudomonas sp. DVZ24]